MREKRFGLQNSHEALQNSSVLRFVSFECMTRISGFMWERHLAANIQTFQKAYRDRMPLPQP
jgi:hypothetical protein